MTLATTIARMQSVLESVPQTGHVHDRIRTDVDRGIAEADYIHNGKVNCWEFSIATSGVHEGASADDRHEAEVLLVAHWEHDDQGNSHNDFVLALDAVIAALINPVSGFPQIGDERLAPQERPDKPIKLRTGQSAYRAVLRFVLLDVSST